MNCPTAAFYILTWIYAVQHPGGDVTERAMTFEKTHKTETACKDEAIRATKIMGPSTGGFALTNDGGKALYSRFVCVEVPAHRPAAPATNEE